MSKVLLVSVLAAFATATSLFAQDTVVKKEDPKGSCTVYVCDKCQKAAAKAGKCCDKDMTAMKCHCIKDGAAACCECPADGKCTLKEGDATKCTNDKPVKKFSLKGLFACHKCCTLADKEGKCVKCGADLVPADKAPACEMKAAAPEAPAAPATPAP